MAIGCDFVFLYLFFVSVGVTIFKGRKEGKCYLMTHSTHFYLRFYGVGHMVIDHLDSQKGNLLLPLHGLFFSISCNVVVFYAPSHRKNRTQHGFFGTPVVDHWL